MERNPLYKASSGGPTPPNHNGMHMKINEVYGVHTAACNTAADPLHMRINEVYGVHTAACNTAADPLHMRINEVYGIQTEHSEEEALYHNADMEAKSHVYDYIPLDSAGNTTSPPATTDIPVTGTPPCSVTNPMSIIFKKSV